MNGLPTLLSLVCLAVSAVAAAQPGLPRSTPEARGISSTAILAFVEAADTQIDTMNSFMLVQGGHVVAEGWWTPYAADEPHILYSLTKSFTSTAVGIAIAEGRLSLDDEVLKFFEDEAPDEPSENLQRMRVHDLIRMATGHESEPDLRGSDAPWPTTFLAHPVPHRPGTHFLYNTPATHMLSEILQRVTGTTTASYLGPRLFEPLAMGEPLWLKTPDGVTTGGYGLSVRTEDIAKFGQLYLQRGSWQGRQLLPARWVDAATRLQVANGSDPDSDWNQGYGYQFWRSRHDSYRGDGAFGQYCLVMPDQDAVVAITSGVADMQAVMDLVFDALLPALPPAMGAAPLAEDRRAHARLEERLARLSVRPVAGRAVAPEGWATPTRFVFAENELGLTSLSFADEDGEATLGMHTTGGEHRLVSRNDGWVRGTSDFAFGLERTPGLADGPQAIAANGAWQSDDTYAVKLVLYRTPFYTTVALRFDGTELHLEVVPHVGFGPKQTVSLAGRRDGS